MCLAVPGQLVSLDSSQTDPLYRTGRVRFGGITREVSLAYVPEAQIGDYVLVHVGLALTIIDETEAQQTLQILNQLEMSP